LILLRISLFSGVYITNGTLLTLFHTSFSPGRAFRLHRRHASPARRGSLPPHFSPRFHALIANFIFLPMLASYIPPFLCFAFYFLVPPYGEAATAAAAQLTVTACSPIAISP